MKSTGQRPDGVTLIELIAKRVPPNTPMDGFEMLAVGEDAYRLAWPGWRPAMVAALEAFYLVEVEQDGPGIIVRER